MRDPSISEMVKQRSMLVILIAACQTARTAFEAADSVVDARLLVDLGARWSNGRKRNSRSSHSESPPR